MSSERGNLFVVRAAEPSPGDRAATDPASQRNVTGALSTERVVKAALQLIDRQGLDALTMRRLAQQLGCEAMTLYRYAENRAALLDGVVGLVLAELVVPEDETAHWQEQLRRIAHSFRELALDHPHVVPLLATRPLATPLGLRSTATLRPLEHMLRALTTAGFSPTEALHVYRVFFNFLSGHVLAELQEQTSPTEEGHHLLELTLHRLPAGQYPLLKTLAPDLAGYDGARELDQALDIIFAGLPAGTG